MNRKVFSIVVLLAMLVSFIGVAPVFAAPAGTAILSINLTNHVQGDTFDVPLVIDTAIGLRGYGINLDFDASRIQVNSVSDGGFLTTAGAGAPLAPVPPVIDNVGGHVTGAAWALLGGAGKSAVGTGNLVVFNVTVKSTAPNGKALFSLPPATLPAVNPKLVDVNAATVASTAITQNIKWIQVGPGPNMGLSIAFTPHGTGSTFDAKVTVSNTGGSASDADTLNLSLSNTTPAATASCPIPVLASGASDSSCVILNAALSTGASNSIATATLVGYGTSKTATYSPTSDTGNTNVDAAFGAFLKITPDTTVNFPALKLGANSVNGKLNVQCNTNYQVDVFDNNATAWHMTEWTGSAFKTIKLQDAMSIASAQNTVTAGSPAKLVTGGVAGQSGDLGQDFPLTYSQPLHYGDPLLPSGETYHLILTLNAYVTL